MNLRDYQIQLVDDVKSAFKKTKRVIMQSPTGSGKTFVFCYMAKLAQQKGNNVLIVTDRVELLKQSGGALSVLGVVFSEIKAGEQHELDNSVHVAMVETLSRRLKNDLRYQIFLSRIDLLILDEAHLRHHDKLFNFLSDHTYVLGATATPLRAGTGSGLYDYFRSLINGPPIESLIKNGNLVPAITYGMPIDFSGVSIKNGEYDPEEQRTKIYSKNKVYSGFIDNWKKHCNGKKTLVFCSNVKASKDLCGRLNGAGLSASHIDGNMSGTAKTEVVKMFRTGEITILTSISMLTTGFDLPDIECIALYRATRSLPLYLQMCGRGARPSEGKRQFTILDFGMNVGRFGFWQEDREWTLNKKQCKKLSEPGLIPVKLCPNCDAMLKITVLLCPFCGHVIDRSVSESRFVMLQELSYKEMVKEKKTVNELEVIRQAKGYKQGWVLRQLGTIDRFKEYGQIKGYKPQWAYMQYKRYTT